jgi:hypothetical protein
MLQNLILGIYAHIILLQEYWLAPFRQFRSQALLVKPSAAGDDFNACASVVVQGNVDRAHDTRLDRAISEPSLSATRALEC